MITDTTDTSDKKKKKDKKKSKKKEKKGKSKKRKKLNSPTSITSTDTTTTCYTRQYAHAKVKEYHNYFIDTLTQQLNECHQLVSNGHSYTLDEDIHHAFTTIDLQMWLDYHCDEHQQILNDHDKEQ